MADYLDALRKDLWAFYEEYNRLRQHAEELDAKLRQADLPGPLEKQAQRSRERVQAEMIEHTSLVVDFLRDSNLDAPHHGFGDAELTSFRAGHAREELVFVMTKFPEPGEPEAPQLQAVIDAVAAALRAQGREPRLATVPLKDLLWHKVQLHMVGCGEGVAIGEDKYRPELNPNVAMEWGYMGGAGRKVRLLQEASFSHQRADFTGRLAETFNWHDPKPGIDAAIKRWFA